MTGLSDRGWIWSGFDGLVSVRRAELLGSFPKDQNVVNERSPSDRDHGLLRRKKRPVWNTAADRVFGALLAPGFRSIERTLLATGGPWPPTHSPRPVRAFGREPASDAGSKIVIDDQTSGQTEAGLRSEVTSTPATFADV